jgi:hypothetical protein
MAWFGKSSKEDIVTIEEQKIKEMIVSILKKENTKVNMAPLSKKYFIINKDIELNILVDGGAELVKTANHKFKYGWKFREAFINQMINLVIEWIETDRALIEEEIFINEVNLLNDINSLVNTLPDFDKVKMIEAPKVEKV